MKALSRFSRQNHSGYTLIELMLVTALIAILASIAIPQFASVVTKSHEGVTKSNLGVLRSALALYYGDNEGVYPTNNLKACLVPRYLDSIPVATYPGHS